MMLKACVFQQELDRPCSIRLACWDQEPGRTWSYSPGQSLWSQAAVNLICGTVWLYLLMLCFLENSDLVLWLVYLSYQALCTVSWSTDLVGDWLMWKSEIQRRVQIWHKKWWLFPICNKSCISKRKVKIWWSARKMLARDLGNKVVFNMFSHM